MPPSPIPAALILPENMGTAWQGGLTTALAIATAVSQEAGTTLPWKTVRDVIDGAIQARFIALTDNSAPWPWRLVCGQYCEDQGCRHKCGQQRGGNWYQWRSFDTGERARSGGRVRAVADAGSWRPGPSATGSEG